MRLRSTLTGTRLSRAVLNASSTCGIPAQESVLGSSSAIPIKFARCLYRRIRDVCIAIAFLSKSHAVIISSQLLTASADGKSSSHAHQRLAHDRTASIKLWFLTSQRSLHTFTHNTDSGWSLHSSHLSLEMFHAGDKSGFVATGRRRGLLTHVRG
jgi:hypothetical protein